MSDSAYADYLRLPVLLDQQVPRSAVHDTELRASEHFFIVIHQSTELLLRQVLDDLTTVVHPRGGRRPDWTVTKARISRAARLTALLRGLLTALRELPREHFHAFRTALGTASGAQSEQFAKVFRVVGVGGDSSPLAGAVVRAAGTPARVPVHVCEELKRLGWEIRQWQIEHLELVVWMLGEDRPGTGGTTGAAWLRSRIAEPPLDVTCQGGPRRGPRPGATQGTDGGAAHDH